MGAANVKHDKLAASENNLLKIPNCVDCGIICEPKMNDGPSDKKSKPFHPKSSANKGKIFPNANFTKDQPLIPSPLQPPCPAPMVSSQISSQDQSSEASSFDLTPRSPRLGSSLSYRGAPAPGWSVQQQDRLRLAVEEISRRWKVRPPGPRAMQELMTAREQGRRDSIGVYDLRSETTGDRKR